MDPIGEEEEEHGGGGGGGGLEAGGCSSSSSTHFFYPGYAPQPWEAHTYVISTSQRRRRWVGAAAAAEASHSNLTIVHAVEASRLPSSLLDKAYTMSIAGIQHPPTDKWYATHSTLVMLGHLGAWEVAYEAEGFAYEEQQDGVAEHGVAGRIRRAQVEVMW